MTEAEFWVHLEFRLCREFAGLPERRDRRWWCDGFIPVDYNLEGPTPRITGHAWICDGPKQSEWEFSLLLPRSTTTREAIDWQALLPPDDVTRWMSFDEESRSIEIDPAAATPDQREG
jgi:hypothetical protein